MGKRQDRWVNVQIQGNAAKKNTKEEKGENIQGGGAVFF